MDAPRQIAHHLLLMVVFVMSSGCVQQPCNCDARPSRVIFAPALAIDARVVIEGNGAVLVVKITNPPGSEIGAWINNNLSTSAAGQLQVTLRDGYGEPIQEECVDDAATAISHHYAVLAPGKSISKKVALACYQLTDRRSVNVEIVYRDFTEDPPPPPDSGAVLIRGPFIFGPKLVEVHQ